MKFREFIDPAFKRYWINFVGSKENYWDQLCDHALQMSIQPAVQSSCANMALIVRFSQGISLTLYTGYFSKGFLGIWCYSTGWTLSEPMFLKATASEAFGLSLSNKREILRSAHEIWKCAKVDTNVVLSDPGVISSLKSKMDS